MSDAVDKKNRTARQVLDDYAPFLTNSDQPLGWLVSTFLDFVSDSKRLLRMCTKPDAREFKKISFACAIGFAIMGFIGYIVKLVFIPINNILVGSGL